MTDEATTCRMLNCDSEPVWMGLCEHHAAWARGVENAQPHERALQNAREALNAIDGVIVTLLASASNEQTLAEHGDGSEETATWFAARAAELQRAMDVLQVAPLPEFTDPEDENETDALLSQRDLVNHWWEQLEASPTEDVAFITRDELNAAMCNAMLLGPPPNPVAPFVVDGSQFVVRGSCLALAQSLKVMGDVLEQRAAQADVVVQMEASPGHVVIARRAEAFVRTLAMGVTRFLAQPDLRVMHGEQDGDLQLAETTINDDGRVWLTCSPVIEDGSPARHYPLDQLVPAGPVHDSVRVAVREMMHVVVEDAVGQLIQGGGLPGMAAFNEAAERFAAGGVVGEGALETRPGEASSETVHHLQAFPEYVATGGARTEPSKPAPQRDEGDALAGDDNPLDGQ